MSDAEAGDRTSHRVHGVECTEARYSPDTMVEPRQRAVSQPDVVPLERHRRAGRCCRLQHLCDEVADGLRTGAVPEAMGAVRQLMATGVCVCYMAEPPWGIGMDTSYKLVRRR